MSSKDELVAQIKGMQRSDANAKQAWWSYCDEQLGGFKDPNKHDAHVLETFLQAYEEGYTAAEPVKSAAKPAARQPAARQPAARRPMSTPSVPMVGAGFRPSRDHISHMSYAAPMMASPVAQSLGDFIKLGQKKSNGWKTAWQAFCAIHGNGVNDPMKHDESFHVSFMDYVGTLASNDLHSTAAAEGISLDGGAVGGKRTSSAVGGGGFSGPPAKRQAMSAPAGAPRRPQERAYGGAAASDGEKAGMVDKIKALQRQDPEAKESWWAYCDSSLAGIKDPNRHDKEALQTFLANYGFETM